MRNSGIFQGIKGKKRNKQEGVFLPPVKYHRLALDGMVILIGLFIRMHLAYV